MGRRKNKATVRDMPWIGVADMAQSLGVCTATVYRYIETGVIEATRAETEGNRGRWKISREFALKFLQGVAGHKLIPTPGPKKKRPPDPVFSVLPGQLDFWPNPKP